MCTTEVTATTGIHYLTLAIKAFGFTIIADHITKHSSPDIHPSTHQAQARTQKQYLTIT